MIEITGRPFTATLPEHRYRYDGVVQIGLSVPRDVLDERIALRVGRMWDAGLVDEVRELEKRGLRDGLTAGRALGYAQVLRFLAGSGRGSRPGRTPSGRRGGSPAGRSRGSAATRASGGFPRRARPGRPRARAARLSGPWSPI